jgi:hypothetical protein
MAFTWEEDTYGNVTLLDTYKNWSVFLQGDDAGKFRKDIHRAEQKEHSFKRNPQRLPLRDMVIEEYFV